MAETKTIMVCVFCTECEISSEIVARTVTLVLPEDCEGQFPTLLVQLHSGASMWQTTDVSGKQKVADKKWQTSCCLRTVR